MLADLSELNDSIIIIPHQSIILYESCPAIWVNHSMTFSHLSYDHDALDFEYHKILNGSISSDFSSI